ncbi:hypothetical protein EDC94DRAFT_594256 [Helicostylum pulchrum]|uniref:F-box/LRR-repeat protein 15-like leucin rich repeat domain-containing protein n=1 Tax=Helicostylum pulchrum TaxID=562976 RepID=A0ABP9XQT2_9FUNG|nr:hypothetical protein EDC94DRAFT_594256 [Helicostylum pulchrum]
MERKGLIDMSTPKSNIFQPTRSWLRDTTGVSSTMHNVSGTPKESWFMNGNNPFNKIYRVLPHVSRYLPSNDLLTFGLVNKKCHRILIMDVIWQAPNFDKLSHIHDALYMFNRFLNYLPVLDANKLHSVQTLDVSNLEETCYDSVNTNFFRSIVTYCPQLQSLNLSNTQFFNSRSLPKMELWSLPLLSVLDLSNCSHVTDDMIVTIARGCRQLTTVKLDGLTRLKGKGVAALAAECDQLSSVSVRNNTSMDDQALAALAKFRNIHLAELNITGCTKLTSTGFEMLARYAAHLTVLSVAKTMCRLPELRRFVCLSRRTKVLDISGCKHLANEQQELARWFCKTEFPQLQDVTMDAATANTIVDFSRTQLVDAYHHIRQIKELRLVGLPQHTPFVYLNKLLHIFPHVKSITFERDYFESDFMLGSYRTPSPDTIEYITDNSLSRFNMRQSRVFARMVHQRESDIDCNLMNW